MIRAEARQQSRDCRGVPRFLHRQSSILHTLSISGRNHCQSHVWSTSLTPSEIKMISIVVDEMIHKDMDTRLKLGAIEIPSLNQKVHSDELSDRLFDITRKYSSVL
jgi:hypothetical protein